MDKSLLIRDDDLKIEFTRIDLFDIFIVRKYNILRREYLVLRQSWPK